MWGKTFFWNFTGYLWNSTLNILSTYSKIQFLHYVAILRAVQLNWRARKHISNAPSSGNAVVVQLSPDRHSSGTAPYIPSHPSLSHPLPHTSAQTQLDGSIAQFSLHQAHAMLSWYSSVQTDTAQALQHTSHPTRPCPTPSTHRPTPSTHLHQHPA